MRRRKTTLLYKLTEVEPIIRACEICHLSMVDSNNLPYVLPLNFGYQDGIIYLHSDPGGKKLDILKSNPNVCINFTADHELFHITENVACSYGMSYKSVIVNGRVEFLTEKSQKIEALNIFMNQYIKNKDFKYSDPAVENVCVFIVSMNDFIGKVYGY